MDYSSKNEMLNAADKGNRVQAPIIADAMNDAAFEEFLYQSFTNADAVIAAGCPFYIWHADTRRYSFLSALRKAGWQERQILVWVKNVFVLGRQDYQWQHEPCLYGWKDGAAHYFVNERTHRSIIEDAQTIDPKKMSKAELVDYLTALLAQPIETTIIREDKPLRNAEHPTMKPIKLFGRLINNSSRLGDNILDSFGGSGTTLIAAEQLGRKAFIMELDPHYCDVILARWEKFTGRQAVRIDK